MDSRFRGNDNNAGDTDLGDAPNSLVPNIPAKSPLARRLGTPACDLPKLDVIPAKSPLVTSRLFTPDRDLPKLDVIPAKSPLVTSRLFTPDRDLPKPNVIPVEAGIHPLNDLDTDLGDVLARKQRE